MIPENTTRKNYRYGQYDGFESRSQRRLHEDLGIDDVAADTILHLRNQVIALQSRIRELEAEIAIQQASQNVRLAGYREISYEATWIELEVRE